MSVCGTGTFISLSFSWQRESRLRSISFPSQLSLHDKRICLLISLTAWTCTTNRTLLLSFCVLHCSNDKEVVQEYQPVVHRLRLSASAGLTTLSGRAFLRNLRHSVDGFSPSFATHTGILTALHQSFRSDFTVLRTLLPLIPLVSIRSFGGVFSPYIFGAESLD